MTKKDKLISVKVPAALDAKLRAYAQEIDGTTSDVVREAVAEYLAKPHRAGKGENLLDRVSDVVGSIEGPTDLSTNPKHMRDYGK